MRHSTKSTAAAARRTMREKLAASRRRILGLTVRSGGGIQKFDSRKLIDVAPLLAARYFDVAKLASGCRGRQTLVVRNDVPRECRPQGIDAPAELFCGRADASLHLEGS